MRPTLDQYFMEIVDVAAKRATCTRRQVGAVIVRDKIIVATGYNGAPSGIPHCTKETCLRHVRGIPSGQQLDICVASHAEQNAIIQAGKAGANIVGATIYVSTSPCLTCAKMIINAGITRVVFRTHYADDLARDILGAANIELSHLGE